MLKTYFLAPVFLPGSESESPASLNCNTGHLHTYLHLDCFQAEIVVVIVKSLVSMLN